MANAEHKATIKPEIQELSDRIGKLITIEKKNDQGVVVVQDGAYLSLLPENLTKETVEAVQEFNGKMAAASALAVGTAAIPIMKKDQNLANVTMSMPTVGKDFIGVNFQRERQVPARDENNQPAGTKTKFGSTSVEYGMYSTKSRGALLSVKTLLAEQAMAAFGNKK